MTGKASSIERFATENNELAQAQALVEGLMASDSLKVTTMGETSAKRAAISS